MPRHYEWTLTRAPDGVEVFARDPSNEHHEEVIAHGQQHHPAVKLALGLKPSQMELSRVIKHILDGGTLWDVQSRDGERARQGRLEVLQPWIEQHGLSALQPHIAQHAHGPAEEDYAPSDLDGAPSY